MCLITKNTFPLSFLIIISSFPFSRIAGSLFFIAIFLIYLFFLFLPSVFYPIWLLSSRPSFRFLFFNQTPGGPVILWFLPLLPQSCRVTAASYPWFIYFPLILGFCGARLRQVNSLVFKWVRCLSLLSAECLAIYGTCCQWTGYTVALMRLIARLLLFVLILNWQQQPFKVNSVLCLP